MTYTEIHKALIDRGLTWKNAAEAIGCTVPHVMNICARRKESVRVAKAISVLIDSDVAIIFEDVPRYTEDKKGESEKRVSDAKAKLEAAGLGAAA